MRRGVFLLGISLLITLAWGKECKFHKVRKGDTLESIAREYGVSLSDIKRYNKNLKENRLKVGQQICIPVKTKAEKKQGDYAIYRVKKGDTLEEIAQKFGVDVKELAKFNGLKSHVIKEGQELKIPARSHGEKVSKKGKEVDYTTYTVKKGAKLQHVAQKLGVPLRELEKLNPELKGKWLKPGTVVKIPKKMKEEKVAEKVEKVSKKGEEVDYTTYTVKKGAKLQHVARKLGVPLRELEKLNPELKGKWLKPGTVVKIPKKMKEEKVAEKVEKVEKKTEREKIPTVEERETPPPPPVEKKISIGKLPMPVEGKIEKAQRGVQIVGNCDQKVRAVESGKVIYSGDDLKAYGNMVIVDHGSFISLYANNSTNLVRRGDTVEKGQAIAVIGKDKDSGRCVLHFELRDKDGIPLNPTEYLRSLQ
ncbi:Peptidase M23 [Thermocrinis albus DSM 14484]|uniref:Peptidase M23 n=1 Tax=Thermocrinis albus (strain DSM 14484 / JCM 11386 / HI 11/12) TaxID=638303 RepID=D3SPJ1_THEAH|nr:LysM peptidoglycan-binding domain-containing protein [Thermocrinis albus]ADC89078.1 Peptidase M23 [Thermocrinis albus DSM 14484]